MIIRSADPTTSASITVSFNGDRILWDPTTAVVYVGARDSDGAAADICCSYLNFFSDRETAASWQTGHPDVIGRILNHADAEALALATFGLLLVDAEAATGRTADVPLGRSRRACSRRSSFSSTVCRRPRGAIAHGQSSIVDARWSRA